MSGKYTNERLREIYDCYQQKGEDEACKTLGLKHETLSRRLREYRERFKNREGQKKYDYVREEKDGNLELSMKSSDIRTIDELLAYAEIDTNIWEIWKSSVNKWGNSDSNVNYQVKVWLKRKEGEELDIAKVCDYIEEKLSKYSKPSKIKYKPDKEGLLYEIGIVDHHLGELAWRKETNFDYDIKIAKQLYENALAFLCDAVSKYKINQILYHVGQDYYNVNSQFNTTVKGTPKDEEGRWQKTFELGLELQLEAINKLKQIAPVHVKIISGNHDEERIYCAGATLKVVFENDKDVEVDNDPIRRKYYKYGENLIGFTHLDEIKPDRLFNLMPVEAKKYWSETKNWEWHVGHLHHETKKILNLNFEEASIRIRTLPTLATIDAWHFKKGYLSQRETQSFLWHPTRGNILQINYRP